MRVATRLRMIENLQALTPNGADPFDILSRNLAIMDDAALASRHRLLWNAFQENINFQKIVTDEDKRRVAAHRATLKRRNRRPVSFVGHALPAFPAND